jgi:hypothetical protein
MNLKNNPTREQLKQLIANAHDNVADHIIVVTKDGAVTLTEFPDTMAPTDVQAMFGDNFQFRFETLQKGNGYVGRDQLTTKTGLIAYTTAWLSSGKLVGRVTSMTGILKARD